MSGHLLVLSVGPVQDFIAAARRTRDLWFGSHLLSEISKATAKSIADLAGFERLIFPAPERVTDLDRWTDLNVANIILSELPDSANPSEVAREAKKGAEHRWLEFVKDAFKEVGPAIRKELWDSQLDDVIEFYAAWVPLGDGDYAAQRKRLMRLFAGRKNCRELRPDAGGAACQSRHSTVSGRAY